MRLITIVGLLMVLTLFALGGSLKDSPEVDAVGIFDNASIEIQNITLTNNFSSPLANSVIKITEQYIHFVGTIIFESSKFMVAFGRDNSDLFEPSSIIKILKFIVVLVIVSLLIKPLFYIGIIIVLIVIWFKDKIMKRKEKENEKETKET